MAGHDIMTRDAAWKLLTEYTKSESLLRHALAVEASMQEYARIFGEDEERWGIVGLLHDFDYERWPDPPDHPLKGAAILQELGWPEDVIDRKSTRLNSSHVKISYAVFCLKKKKQHYSL